MEFKRSSLIRIQFTSHNKKAFLVAFFWAKVNVMSSYHHIQHHPSKLNFLHGQQRHCCQPLHFQHTILNNVLYIIEKKEPVLKSSLWLVCSGPFEELFQCSGTLRLCLHFSAAYWLWSHSSKHILSCYRSAFKWVHSSTIKGSRSLGYISIKFLAFWICQLFLTLTVLPEI